MPQVVGGGLTGLTVAFRLKRFAPDTAATVLEPRDHPGGNICTEDHRGFRVECGPSRVTPKNNSARKSASKQRAMSAVPSIIRITASRDRQQEMRSTLVNLAVNHLATASLQIRRGHFLDRRPRRAWVIGGAQDRNRVQITRDGSIFSDEWILGHRLFRPRTTQRTGE